MGRQNCLVWVKGAGDLATGVAFRLLQARYNVILTDLPIPLCVRRTVAFAEAIAAGRWEVEGYCAVRVGGPAEAYAALAIGLVPVMIDPSGRLALSMKPHALVDAIMAKRNTGTAMTDAGVVVALGPGFTARVDCHAVIETSRGHYLGRTHYEGSAAADTGEPGEIGGIRSPRVLRAPVAGVFRGCAEIGEMLRPGDQVGEVQPAAGEPQPVVTPIGGVLRGLIRTGAQVPVRIKVGDVDPTGEVARCHTVSDKALAVGGGVLEALLRLL